MLLPLRLDVRRSLSLGLSLAAAHALAAAGLYPTDLPFAAKLALWALIALSLYWQVARPPSHSALVLQGDGRLSLCGEDGRHSVADVSSETTVLPWLIVLAVKGPAGPARLVLPVDALGVAQHRQLRLWLRWRAALSAA
jgi:hypothetical protein